MNLTVLQKSRKRVRVGDVFAMLPCDGQFVFGRVIGDDARPFPDHPEVNALLLYIFRFRAPKPTPPHRLPASALLIPPVITNRRAWTEGYFMTVENRPIETGEQLPRHVFRDYLFGRLVDEFGRPTAPSDSPVGEFGLGSYRTVDAEVSAALGLPLAPD